MEPENKRLILKTIFENILVSEIMKKKPITIYSDQEVSEAQEMFTNHMLSHLLVIDREQQLIGLLTQKYLYKAQSPRKFLTNDILYDPNIIVDGDAFHLKESLNSYILSKMMKKFPFTLPKLPLYHRPLGSLVNIMTCAPILTVRRS